MNKYVEMLKKANEVGINVTELWIADNVTFDVMNSINDAMHTEEEIDAMIETICGLVKGFYLSSHNLSISDISRAISELHFYDGMPLKDITRSAIIDMVNSWI